MLGPGPLGLERLFFAAECPASSLALLPENSWSAAIPGGRLKGRRAGKKGAQKHKASPKKAAEPKKKTSKRDAEAVAKLSPAKRRQLTRRDTEDAVERFVERKLSHIPFGILDAVTNKERLTLHELIRREVKSTRSANGRISSKFMVKLYVEYELGSQVFRDLREPSEEESLDEEVFDLLGQCHDENPVLRNPKPLVKFLDMCSPLSYTNLNGLLNGIVEGPLLSHAHAQKLQVATLAYVSRTHGFKHGER